MSDKVVLAYSGGLDTSAAIRWLKEKYDLYVIALTVDVGNERNFSAIRDKALKVGAIKALVRDVKKQFVSDYIFPALQADTMPLGLPVYFSGVSRDRVNAELGKAGIGLAIHWEEIASHPGTRGNRLAVELSSRMLTLVIDQRTSRRQLDYLALNLVRGIEAAKTEPGGASIDFQ